MLGQRKDCCVKCLLPLFLTSAREYASRTGLLTASAWPATVALDLMGSQRTGKNGGVKNSMPSVFDISRTCCEIRCACPFSGDRRPSRLTYEIIVASAALPDCGASTMSAKAHNERGAQA